jgi:transcriptional regulator with XRE-family HTH domain
MSSIAIADDAGLPLRRSVNITAHAQRRYSCIKTLALASGIDRSYMGRIERGEQSISVDKMLDISEALSIKPEELFKGWD